MNNYHALLQNILDTGTEQANRTGVNAISIPGAMLKFDLANGFPAITTKKLAWKAVVGELIGFLRGFDNAAQFRELGCGIWDANANKNPAWLANPNRKGPDDLGRIYGVQWRDWRGGREVVGDSGRMTITKEGSIDQVLNALNTIRNDPTNRRIIINAWRPDEFDAMALPPCHVLYQFIVNVERGELSLCMYQRSCDMFLGVPFNIASSALLLSIFARLTGLAPRHFTHFLADAHIYVNHVDQVKEQLSRSHFAQPKLEMNFPLGIPDAEVLAQLRPEHFHLVDYRFHAAIQAEMAV